MAVYDDSKSVTKYFILQDANFNVVAVTDESGSLLQQYRYEPYGLRSGIDDGNGDPIDESLALIPQGFQGLWWDPVTGVYHMRNRDMSPEFQRALQRDPNQTALLFNTALLQNAQTPMAFVSLSAGGQYADGLGLYTLYESNPNTRRDPSGLYAEFDWFGEDNEFELEWSGQRLYALGAINEGARWAALGLQTTLDIAGALLGIDVFESVHLLASGRGGFWDSMNIVMAVSPAGRIAKVGGKLYRAAKYTRKAQSGLIAVDKARRLAKIARRISKNSKSFKNAVKKAKKQYPKLARKKPHKHHIIPKYLGGPKDGDVVELNPAYHQWITNAFRREWAYGRKRKPSPDELKKIIQRVYNQYPIPFD